jgi:hypothetical protein
MVVMAAVGDHEKRSCRREEEVGVGFDVDVVGVEVDGGDATDNGATARYFYRAVYLARNGGGGGGCGVGG